MHEPDNDKFFSAGSILGSPSVTSSAYIVQSVKVKVLSDKLWDSNFLKSQRLKVIFSSDKVLSWLSAFLLQIIPANCLNSEQLSSFKSSSKTALESTSVRKVGWNFSL